MRATYPSDINNQQWRYIRDIIPPPEKVGRHRTVDEREIINAINYRWSTGCSWRMLPHDFPQWGTVYAYFRRWQRLGLLRDIRNTLLNKAFSSQAHRTHQRNLPRQYRDKSPSHTVQKPAACSG